MSPLLLIVLTIAATCSNNLCLAIVFGLAFLVVVGNGTVDTSFLRRRR